MHPRHYVTFSLGLATFLSPAQAASGAAVVQSDLTNISGKTASLITAINALPLTNRGFGVLSIPKLITIGNAFITLNGAIGSAIGDVKASDAFTETETNAILGLVQTFVPTVQQALTDATNLKPAADGVGRSDSQWVPLTSLALFGFKTIKYDSSALLSALEEKMPAGLESKVQEQGKTIDDAFASAIAVYSS